MAKKSKPGKKNNPASDNSAPATETDTKPVSSKSGLSKIMLPSILGSALVIAILGALLHFLILVPANLQQQSIYGNARAQHFLSNLVQLGSFYETQVNAITKSQLIQQALIDPSRIASTEKQLQELFPSASNVKLFPKGKAKKITSTVPPISFAQLDMIAKAEKNNRALPEIHYHKKIPYLTLVKPVESNGNTIGSLLINLKFIPLKTLIPTLNQDEGYVELRQTFSNKAQPVFISGNSALNSKLPFKATDKRITHWSAHYFPSPTQNTLAHYTTLIWALLGASFVLIIVLGMISSLMLNKSLQSNATAMAAFFQSIIQKSPSKLPFTLGIFTSLSQTLQRQFSDYDSKTHVDLAKSQTTATPKKPAKNGKPDLSKDVLDVGLNSDDDNLLSTASDFNDDPLDMLDLGDDSPDDMALDTVELAEPESSMLEVNVTISPQIFRAYDIRGIVGETLDTDIASAIGAAVGSEAKEQEQIAIIVARDGRHSSQELAEALIEGIQSTGLDVIDIGEVPTPVLYFGTKTLRTQTGVMVTGSHNPPEYNGFKIVINDHTLAQGQIQALKTRIDNGQFTAGKGNYERLDIQPDYLDRITSDVVLAKPMRIILDTGNGVAGPLANQLLDKLGCMVTPLFSEIDGNFPNHHPDPSNPENLQHLIQSVQNENADLGIAMDGDGDRIGVVTNSGKIIWADRLLMLYAQDLLSRTPGADILYDVKCTRDVAELVSGLGGRAIMSATGHSIMKAKMKETGAVVGGELSGHIFFNDRWYGFDDALYSAARLLEILSMEPYNCDEVFAGLPEKANTPELSIPVSEDTKFKLIEKLGAQGHFDGGNLVNMDGIRVDFPDCWGLVRASNTGPILVARFEGDTEDSLEKVKSIFRDQLLAVEPSLNLPF